jgi:hypothetical protein
VRKEALVDAIHVVALFSMIVRLADSLGWYVPPDEAFSARAQAMHDSGYELVTLPTAPPSRSGGSDSGRFESG